MKPVQWHRLFGLLLTDFFTGSPYVVELEKDLTLKKQLLDVVILRRGKGRFRGQLPDGFENLAAYNLITFKSYLKTLDDWALLELIGHYVNYRKQISPSFDKLLPEDQFNLYAVCGRLPRELAAMPGWTTVQNGVHECRRGTGLIRIIVLTQLPKTENNAILHLLSGSPDQVQYGTIHYKKHSEETSTLLDQVFEDYEREGLTMPYTMEDFKREYLEERIQEATVEQRLKGLSPDQRLEGLSPEQIRQRLSLDQRLEGLSPEEIEAYLRKQKSKPATSKRKKK